MAEPEVVPELQEGTLEQRLAVCSRQVVVVVIGRHQVVAVGLVSRVEPLGSLLEPQMSGVHRQALAVALAVAAPSAKGNVASARVEFAVYLQRAVQILAVAVTDGVTFLRVDNYLVAVQFLKGIVVEWILHVEIRVLVVRGRGRSRATVISRPRERGAEHDVSQGVGLPLYTSLGVPAVAARVVLAYAVRERTHLADEVLSRVTRVGVAVAVIPEGT